MQRRYKRLCFMVDKTAAPQTAQQSAQSSTQLATIQHELSEALALVKVCVYPVHFLSCKCHHNLHHNQARDAVIERQESALAELRKLFATSTASAEETRGRLKSAETEVSTLKQVCV